MMPASEILDRLYSNGVDNWEGFEIAMEGVVNPGDDDEVLSALLSAGVDNWEGFDI